jgi:hypothetical protein
MGQSSTGAKKHTGTCHCGAVRFEVELDLGAGASRCNCSVCTKVGITSAIAKPSAFVLLSDEAALGMYEWGGKTAQRYFCKTCGIHCFGRGYLEQVGGAYVSVNLNTVDDLELSDLKVSYWDGRHDNWQAGTRSTPWPILAKAASSAASA